MNREKIGVDTAVEGGVGMIPVGLAEVDRRLGGGVPEGSTVALLGTPTSSSERLCHQFATTHASESGSPASSGLTRARDVFYVATDAPTRNAVPDRDRITHFQDLSTAIEELSDHVEQNQQSDDQTPILIIDRFSDLLDNESETVGEETNWFEEFNVFADAVHAGNTAALVHLHIPDGRPLTSAEARIFSMADTVFNYDTGREDGRADRLYIPKARAAAPPEDRFVLEIGEQLTTNPDQQV